LQHVTFIYKEGFSTLPPLSTFTAKFPNNFSWRHVPASIVDSVHWWKSVLSAPCSSHSLTVQLKFNPDIWVDALSSWGIGIVVGNHWATWHLCEGWHAGDRDIGWAKSVALELAIMWLVPQELADFDITVRGDNTSIIQQRPFTKHLTTLSFIEWLLHWFHPTSPSTPCMWPLGQTELTQCLAVHWVLMTFALIAPLMPHWRYLILLLISDTTVDVHVMTHVSCSSGLIPHTVLVLLQLSCIQSALGFLPILEIA